jgi:hypothetical protein
MALSGSEGTSSGRITGCALAQVVSRQPVATEARVRPRVSPVRFVVDRVALGQVFVRVLRVFLVNVIPPWLSIVTCHLRG